MAFSFGQPAQSASTSAQPAPSFSFGGANNAASKPAGGFSFGATPAQTQQQPQQSGSNLFGNLGQQQQSQQSQQPQQSGFGSSPFGQPAQQQPQQGGTPSLFGGNTANNTGGGLFGQSQQQNQQQSNKPAFSLGNTNTNPSTSANPLTLSQLNTQPSYQQQQMQNKPLQQSFGFQSSTTGNTAGAANVANRDNNAQKRLGVMVNDKLEAIRAAWDVRDLQTCRFLVSGDFKSI